MKKTLFIIGFLAAMALCSNSLQAQDLRDRIGNQTGKIDNSGTVRDRIGNSIGSAKGVDKKHAAVFFFFNKFDQ